MDTQTQTRPAPPDDRAAQAYEHIMRIARDHCLIIGAYGGVATIATPEAQRSHGVRAQVLRAHGRTEAEEVTNG